MVKNGKDKKQGAFECMVCEDTAHFVMMTMQEDETWKEEIEECRCKRQNPDLDRRLPVYHEYTLRFVTENAIPARCKKCKREFTGRDAIRSPELGCSRCFYCSGELAPIGDWQPPPKPMPHLTARGKGQPVLLF